eukprot:20745_1
MTQIMFESFDVPKYYVAVDAVLSLYAKGRTTGIVLDTGHDVTHTVPIYEGYYLPHATLRSDLSGRGISLHLAKLLKEKLPRMTWRTEINLMNDIKQKLCYIAMDYDAELKKKNEIKYECPDGNIICIQSELFQATETLFKPDLMDLEQDGIHELLTKSIQKCDVDIRNDLYENIVICGGNSMYKGFNERLLKELQGILGESEILIDGYLRLNYCDKNKILCEDIVDLMYKFAMNKVYIVDDVITDHGLDHSQAVIDLWKEKTTKQLLAWKGGSILCSLSTFEDMWITKDEYDEAGWSIVHRKCT